MFKFDTKFELPLRHAIFIAIILATYLLFGAFVFLLFASINTEKVGIEINNLVTNKYYLKLFII